MLRTIRDVTRPIKSLNVRVLPPPVFREANLSNKLVLGVHSMQDHTTDEGWQITHGLSLSGYTHCGHLLEESSTSVPELIEKHNPGTMVIQDVREWDVQSKDFRDMDARFTDVEEMKRHEEIFRVTILKDAHQRPDYHREFCDRMGIHAWVIYYNPSIVKHLAQYVRPEHLIRTTHSLDKDIIPEFSEDREFGCLFSGAVSNAYPLRQRIMKFSKLLPMKVHKHPGYHRNGCVVPEFMKMLNTFKVSICTSSRYGYALRKLIESTACGCRIITDLPTNEVLPVIEENLIRVNVNAGANEIKRAIDDAVDTYDYDRQRELAIRSIEYYDYRTVCMRLANDIQLMKERY